MSPALHYWMEGAHHCSGHPVSEMTCTVSSGTLNPTIPDHSQHSERCVLETKGCDWFACVRCVWRSEQRSCRSTWISWRPRSSSWNWWVEPVATRCRLFSAHRRETFAGSASGHLTRSQHVVCYCICYEVLLQAWALSWNSWNFKSCPEMSWNLLHVLNLCRRPEKNEHIWPCYGYTNIYISLRNKQDTYITGFG